MRKLVGLTFLSGTDQSAQKTGHVVSWVLLFALFLSSALVSAKCPIKVFDIEGHSLPRESISLFLGVDRFSSGYEGIYSVSSNADGFFSLRVQYSAVHEGVFRRCRFPSGGDLIVRSESGQLRRYGVDLTLVRDPSVRKIFLSLDR